VHGIFVAQTSCIIDVPGRMCLHNFKLVRMVDGIMPFGPAVHESLTN
jgi:hypothetical protein